MLQNLFKPGKIGSMDVKNRIVMTAMGNGQADTSGSVNDTVVSFYTERAKGGVGLIITECCIVDEETGRGNLHQLGIFDDRFIPGLERLSKSVHGYGAKIAAQIYHPGRQGFNHVNGGKSMPSPSGIPDAMTGQEVHEMSRDEIHGLVEKFSRSARRAQAAGFDAVEIHGAHGYLLNTFLSPYSNVRTDDYGGSTENRCRIVCEIIGAIRDRCGADFPVLVRISADEFLERAGKPGEGIKPGEAARIAEILESAGADAINVSSGTYETMNTAWEPVGYDEGWKLSLASEVKSHVSIPVIAVSAIRSPEFADRALAEGTADFIASARAHFADPGWSVKAEAGDYVQIRPCISCLYCMESLMAADMTGKPSGCSVNPRTGRENLYPKLPQNGGGRTVVVAGGGPAGMEASLVLAERGFRPVLVEKNQRLGGQLNYASKPPNKSRLDELIRYYENELKRLDVDVRLSTECNRELINELKPHAVILATGSVPILPGSIPGLTRENVYTPPEILSGKSAFTGKRIAVVGSGMTGIETAEFLAQEGNSVDLYEMEDAIGPGLYFQNLIEIMGSLESHSAGLFPGHKLLKIEGSRAFFEKTANGDIVSGEYDAFVISLGTRPDTPLLTSEPDNGDVQLIGDCNKPGRICHAVSSGFAAACGLG